MTKHSALFILRMGFFCLEYPIWLLDRFAFRILSLLKKPEFVREGGCQRTGQCCRAIGMGVPRSWLKFPKLIAAINIWHRWRYNFTPIGTYDGMIVYQCHFLTRDNTCSIHRFKPALCRDFPKLPLWGRPKLHKGCGYNFVRRNKTEFERILDRNIES